MLEILAPERVSFKDPTGHKKQNSNMEIGIHAHRNSEYVRRTTK